MGKRVELLVLIAMCLVLLSLEQLYGLPVLVFFLLLQMSFRYVVGERVSLWVVVGLGLAGMFNLPLSWGLALVFGVAGVSVVLEPVLKGINTRALLVSMVGAVVVGWLAQVSWTAATFGSVLVSLCIALVLARQVFWSRV